MKKRITRVLVLFLAFVMVLQAVPVEGNKADAATTNVEIIYERGYFTENSFLMDFTVTYSGDRPKYFHMAALGDAIVGGEYIQREYAEYCNGTDTSFSVTMSVPRNKFVKETRWVCQIIVANGDSWQYHHALAAMPYEFEGVFPPYGGYYEEVSEVSVTGHTAKINQIFEYTGEGFFGYGISYGTDESLSMGDLTKAIPFYIGDASGKYNETWEITGLTPNTTYYYAPRVYNWIGSNISQETPYSFTTTDHDWDEGVYNKNTGMDTYTCTYDGCNATKTEKHIHEWNGAVISKAATPTSRGEKTYTCN